eukprot:s2176_g12.t1
MVLAAQRPEDVATATLLGSSELAEYLASVLPATYWSRSPSLFARVADLSSWVRSPTARAALQMCLLKLFPCLRRLAMVCFLLCCIHLGGLHLVARSWGSVLALATVQLVNFWLAQSSGQPLLLASCVALGGLSMAGVCMVRVDRAETWGRGARQGKALPQFPPSRGPSAPSGADMKITQSGSVQNFPKDGPDLREAASDLFVRKALLHFCASFVLRPLAQVVAIEPLPTLDLLICDIRWQGTRNATHIGLFFSASEFSDCLRVWPLSQLFNPKMTCQATFETLVADHGVQVDLPIAVDVSCAPIVVPDDAPVPEAAEPSEPSEPVPADPAEAEAAPEAAPTVVKPPCGEELWNCVRGSAGEAGKLRMFTGEGPDAPDALAAEPWESKDPKVPSSLVVFDWDDTLLPTSALVAAKRIAPAPGATVAPCAAAAQLSDWEFDDLLESCAKAAVEALQKASKYGRVVIITNSGFGWVHETAARFMPSVLGELEKIPVISARAIFECQGVPEPYRWKVLCFRRIVECFSFDPSGETGPSSLISIGDGWQERLAAIMAAQDTDLGLVKCLKFLEQPGMDQLVQQLNLCSQIFAGLVAHPGWVEASYSYNDVEGSKGRCTPMPGHPAPNVAAPAVDGGFYVAIPSYQRVEIIQEKTLALLKQQGVPRHRVYIFVADASEYETYHRAIGTDWPNIVIGVKTLWRQRNFITEFFKEGTHIVSMDDDLEGLFQCSPCTPELGRLDVHLAKLPKGSLQTVAEDAVQRMKKSGAFLWSLNVSDNPFYMYHGVSQKNGLCNGFFWGCLNRHLPELRLRLGDGHEDVERSVRFYQRDGALLRYRFMCAKTRCKTNSGGLQSLLKDRSREEEEGVRRLVAEFPRLLYLAPGSKLGLKFRSSMHPELMQQNLLSGEGFKVLQSRGEVHLLEGACWAAVKGLKGRKALSIICGTVDRCTQKGVCLRLGSDGPASSRGDFLGVTCVDFYAKLSASELQLLWLPEAASKALGVPHRTWTPELQQLLQLPEPGLKPRESLPERVTATPRAVRGGFLRMLQGLAGKKRRGDCLQLEARADNTAALGGSFAASQVNGTVEVVSAEDCQDMEGIETEDVSQSCEKAAKQRFVEDSVKAAEAPNPANGQLNCTRSPRRRRCNKASLLARAGKMQALPLQQSYLTMCGRQKVATRRRWFQARKKSVRTLKATNIVNYWCSFDLNRKKLEIPIIWVLLWLQGLQVLPVSGPTFGQSCGLQSTHCLILAETIRCIWSQRLRMMSANV